jgi:hypothetical protein
MRMGHLRAFFERIAEWDYPDTRPRIPVFASDRPIKDRPLPRFLDDPSAEVHPRMLGNGYCARPVELDCHFESICESCTLFVTTI